ncbi:MAG: toll/interleukin-1 receptor domain-containing protein [Bacteroidota bacterium]
MSNVQGEQNRALFAQLMTEVLAKAGLPEITRLNSNDLRNLSRKLKEELPHQKEISYSTLRDYRYKILGRQNYTFSISLNHSDLLCNYVGYAGWTAYKMEHNTEPTTVQEKIRSSQSITGHKVFICYNDADLSEARLMADQLKEVGIECWMRDQQLLIGENSIVRISEEIKKATTGTSHGKSRG